jgi:hypothetical protein
VSNGLGGGTDRRLFNPAGIGGPYGQEMLSIIVPVCATVSGINGLGIGFLNDPLTPRG